MFADAISKFLGTSGYPSYGTVYAWENDESKQSPLERGVLCAIISVLLKSHGMSSLSEINGFLSLGGYGNIDDGELKTVTKGLSDDVLEVLFRDFEDTNLSVKKIRVEIEENLWKRLEDMKNIDRCAYGMLIIVVLIMYIVEHWPDINPNTSVVERLWLVRGAVRFNELRTFYDTVMIYDVRFARYSFIFEDDTLSFENIDLSSKAKLYGFVAKLNELEGFLQYLLKSAHDDIISVSCMIKRVI